MMLSARLSTRNVLLNEKVFTREQTRKSSMNGLMRGAYNQCGDGQCDHDHRGQTSNSAATGQPDFQSIVAMTIAALNNQKGGSQPRGRPAEKKVNVDGTPRFGFEPECFECGKSGHNTAECPIYKAQEQWEETSGTQRGFRDSQR